MQNKDKKNYTEGQIKSRIDWQKKNSHRIPFDVPSECFPTIQEAAAAASQPINTYIKNALMEKMAADGFSINLYRKQETD